MATRTVEICTCDSCNKNIDGNGNRFTIRLARYSETYDVPIYKKDLCEECFTTFSQLIGETGKVENKKFKAIPPKKAETKNDDVETEPVPKKRTAKSAERHMEKIREMYTVGWSYEDMARNLGVSKQLVSYYVTKLRKQGVRQGDKKLVEARKREQNLKPVTTVVVDKYGFVM